IVAGESGAASLGGLIAVADSGDELERAKAGLTADAVVLLINTEWATDPANYQKVVGTAPDTVQDETDARRRESGVTEL
ncbi:MAG TPA: hypothetical protein VFT01_03310, partial [Homoserinimonas sp.]|nr:hypothetical protein [Homoserinimonas sp.]